MSQRHSIQNDQLMFITTNTFKRQPIFTDPGMARLSIETLYNVKTLHPFLLFSFVVMPDHWHMLIRVPPPGSISKIMNSWKSAVVMNSGLKKIWQARFYTKIINDQPENVISYIHQNPVKAGLTTKAANYPWSSASEKFALDSLDWEMYD